VRLPRVRFSMRWMIFGVAAAALLLWCSLMVPRVTLSRQRLATCAVGEAQFRRNRIYTEARSVRLASEGNMELSHRYRALSNKYRIMEDWASGLRKKYEQAMWCPWLPLPPDPPPPVRSL
jgi:hypothetical protein